MLKRLSIKLSKKGKKKSKKSKKDETDDINDENVDTKDEKDKEEEETNEDKKKRKKSSKKNKEEEETKEEKKKRKKSSKKEDKKKKKSKKSRKSSADNSPATSDPESEEPTPASTATDSEAEPSTDQSEATDASEDPKARKSSASDPTPKGKPKLTFKEERKLGYMTTTGKYKDTDKYCSERYQLSVEHQQDKVEELDKEWKEKEKQRDAECRAYPPKRKFKEFFWTTGHYKFWEDLWAQISGSVPKETEANAAVDADGEPIVEGQNKDNDTKDKDNDTSDKDNKDTENEKKDGAAEENADTTEPTSRKKSKKSKSKSKSLKGEAPGQNGELSTHRLQVGNIPASATHKDLDKLFPKAAEITMVPDPSGSGKMTATVRFKDTKKALKAFKKQKNAKIGGSLLVVAPKVKD